MFVIKNTFFGNEVTDIIFTSENKLPRLFDVIEITVFLSFPLGDSLLLGNILHVLHQIFPSLRINVILNQSNIEVFDIPFANVIRVDSSDFNKNCKGMPSHEQLNTRLKPKVADGIFLVPFPYSLKEIIVNISTIKSIYPNSLVICSLDGSISYEEKLIAEILKSAFPLDHGVIIAYRVVNCSLIQSYLQILSCFQDVEISKCSVQNTRIKMPNQSSQVLQILKFSKNRKTAYLSGDAQCILRTIPNKKINEIIQGLILKNYYIILNGYNRTYAEECVKGINISNYTITSNCFTLSDVIFLMQKVDLLLLANSGLSHLAMSDPLITPAIIFYGSDQHRNVWAHSNRDNIQFIIPNNKFISVQEIEKTFVIEHGPDLLPKLRKRQMSLGDNFLSIANQRCVLNLNVKHILSLIP